MSKKPDLDVPADSEYPDASMALGHVLRCLDLDALDDDLYLGDPGPGTGRLFGGMVAAQSVAAAARTVDQERAIHSLHAYFLRPGRHDRPLRFVVDRIRDGRSFTTRRVVAHQAGEAIFNLAASFAVTEEGIEHQHGVMPEVPPPEECPDREHERFTKYGEEWVNHPVNAVEVRATDGLLFGDGQRTEPVQHLWIRLRGKVDGSASLQAALLTYASDRSLLATAARPHGVRWGRGMGASLDHAVWFHQPTDLNQWHLFTSESPAAHAARGIIFCGVYRHDGVRVASIAQEALIRPGAGHGHRKPREAAR